MSASGPAEAISQSERGVLLAFHFGVTRLVRRRAGPTLQLMDALVERSGKFTAMVWTIGRESWL
jgi:hypothetical protein